MREQKSDNRGLHKKCGNAALVAEPLLGRDAHGVGEIAGELGAFKVILAVAHFLLVLVALVEFCRLALRDAREERLRIVRVEVRVGGLNSPEERFFALVQYENFICNLQSLVAVRREDNRMTEER